MDAYTLRKIAPRILIGVIGINLSIYLCVAAIDITNIVGRGLMELLAGPFNTEKLSVDAGSGNIAAILTVLGSLIAGSIVFLGAGGGSGFLGVLLMLVLTIMLLVLAIMITLAIRQTLLVLLTVLSPVAIALFILPGTEKYFRQWWDLFLKTLMVYPIIAALFAVSGIMATISFESTNISSNLQGAFQVITGLILIFIPLFMIPFAFRMAGGAIGGVFNAANGMRSQFAGWNRDRLNRANQDPTSALNRANKRFAQVERRAEWADRLKTAGSREDAGRFRRRAARRLARAVGGYNIEARASALRAETSKIMNDQINTGRDEEIRGLTVNKHAVDSMGDEAAKAAGKLRIENGMRQYKSLGGRWINEADVLAGQNRWGHDTFAQQAALSYEMRKAQTDDELRDLAKGYSTVATGQGGWGMTDGQAAGAWIGAAFENQNQHLEYKYTDWKTGEMDAAKAKSFATEVYEKRGSYPLSQMGGHTFAKLKESYDLGDDDTKKQIRSIAETFVYRGGAPGARIRPGEKEGEEQLQMDMPPDTEVPVTQGGKQSVQTSAQGAAHVSEAVRDLAVHVGVYQPDEREHLESPVDPSTLPPNPHK